MGANQRQCCGPLDERTSRQEFLEAQIHAAWGRPDLATGTEIQKIGIDLSTKATMTMRTLGASEENNVHEIQDKTALTLIQTSQGHRT